MIKILMKWALGFIPVPIKIAALCITAAAYVFVTVYSASVIAEKHGFWAGLLACAIIYAGLSIIQIGSSISLNPTLESEQEHRHPHL